MTITFICIKATKINDEPNTNRSMVGMWREYGTVKLLSLSEVDGCTLQHCV